MIMLKEQFDISSIINILENIVRGTSLFRVIKCQTNKADANLIINANNAFQMHIWLLDGKAQPPPQVQGAINQAQANGHHVYIARDNIPHCGDLQYHSSAVMDILAYMLNECYDNKWHDAQLNALQKRSRIERDNVYGGSAIDDDVEPISMEEVRRFSHASGTGWDNLYYG